MLPEIFLRQKRGIPDFHFPKSFPGQKSPSAKTATLDLGKITSGFPGKFLTFFLYLSIFQKGFIVSPRSFSISVSFTSTFAIKMLLCFFESLSILFVLHMDHLQKFYDFLRYLLYYVYRHAVTQLLQCEHVRYRFREKKTVRKTHHFFCLVYRQNVFGIANDICIPTSSVYKPFTVCLFVYRRTAPADSNGSPYFVGPLVVFEKLPQGCTLGSNWFREFEITGSRSTFSESHEIKSLS